MLTKARVCTCIEKWLYNLNFLADAKAFCSALLPILDRGKTEAVIPV